MKQSRIVPVSPEAELRIGSTLTLPEVLGNLGANPDELFTEAGIDLKLFDDPNNRISFKERGHLIAHCVARTGCQHLGLLVGQNVGLHSLGLVGLLVKYSTDVGTALRSLARFFHLHVHGAVVNLETRGEFASLSYEIYQPDTKAIDQVGDGAVASAYNILSELCGPLWKPSEIKFVHSKREDVRPYQSFFKAPLVFDAEINAVEFNADWLNFRLPHTDPQLLSMLQRQIDMLDVSYGRDLPEQIRSLLRTALLTGHDSIDQVAELFSMHSRTLRRHLKECGTNFQELVDEGRYEIARQLLEGTRMNVCQIASILNYSDQRAFARAFRRWSGTTPTQWRNDLKANLRMK